MADRSTVESLLTEHLRYTPITLLDDIINLVNELTNRAVDAVEEGLLSADPATLGFKPEDSAEGSGASAYPHAKREIEEGVHQLETLLEGAVDKNFDRLELWTLQNILTLPPELVPWVRLGHYQNVSLPVQSSDEKAPQPSPESLYALQRKLLETRKLHSVLQAEKMRNAALLSNLRSALSAAPGASTNSDSQTLGSDGPLAFLHTAPAAQNLGLRSPVAATTTSALGSSHGEQHGPGPLTTQTTFTLAQLPSLRALLTELKPALSALPSAPTGDEPGERRAYVERLARRAVERRGGDVDGGAVDGRRVGAEEVRGVEGFVAGLGGSREERMDEGD